MGFFKTSSSFPRTILLACALALAASVGAAAQPAISVRGNVGASFFRSPDLLNEALHSGVDVGVGAGIEIYRGLSFTVRGGIDRFTLNEQSFRRVGFRNGGDVSFLSGSLGLRYTYENETDAHPYVAIGGGRYRRTISNLRAVEDGELVNLEGSRADTRLGTHLALGSLLRFNDRYALFFEPRYVLYDLAEGPGDAQRYVTLRLGVDVQFGEGGLF